MKKKERKNNKQNKYYNYLYCSYCSMSLFFSILVGLFSVNQTKYTGIWYWLLSGFVAICFFSISMLFGTDSYNNDIKEQQQQNEEKKVQAKLERKKTA